jgi:hypothetical protein
MHPAVAELLALILTAVGGAYVIYRMAKGFELLGKIEDFIRKRNPKFDGFGGSTTVFIVSILMILSSVKFVDVVAWLFGWKR